MIEIFERFTDRARRVTVLAQEQARELNHPTIGTEHILLALLGEGDGVAAVVLGRLGIDFDQARQAVIDIVGTADEGAPTGQVPFTPRAKKVLELALREALQIGHNYIGTEHILLGLLREGEGVAALVLVKLGVDLTAVRHEVIETLNGYYDQAKEGLPPRATHIKVELSQDEAAEVMAWWRGFVSFTGPLSPDHPMARLMRKISVGR